MESFLKHSQYENYKSFIPEVLKAESNTSENLIILLSEQDLSNTQNLPQDLQQPLQNKNLQQTLKKNQTYTLFTPSTTYTLFFSSKTEVKTAYKTARKHHQTILKLQQQQITIQFTSVFTQKFINEYLYGVFIQNYEYQQKSYPENKDINEVSSVHKPVQRITVISGDFDEKNVEFGELKTIAQAKLFSKQLNNTRANIADTEYMFNVAKEFSEQNKEKIDFFYLQGEQIKKEGLNLMYAVGQANVKDSYLVCMKYNGNPDQPDNVQALVGKGVVYDCGGLSLKKMGMERMHGDKGGACTCLGIFKGIVELGLKINVVCTLAIVENCIDGNCYRNSDIIQTLKGINVEICNTDAEGRNILADAMTFTQQKYKPNLMFDIATLTGACAQTLGQTAQAVFSNDLDEVPTVVKFSGENYEDLWHLPITDWMRENIQSDQGDIRNAGKSNFGGSGTAAAFLEHFVEKDVKWFHFDIASSNQVKGEGQPVRTLINYLRAKYSA